MGHLKAQPVPWVGAHHLGFLVVIPTAMLPGGGDRRVLLVLLQARGVHSGPEEGGTCPKGHGRALLDPISQGSFCLCSLLPVP